MTDIALPDGTTAQRPPRMAEVNKTYAGYLTRRAALEAQRAALAYPVDPDPVPVDREAQRARAEHLEDVRRQLQLLNSGEDELKAKASAEVRSAAKVEFDRIVELLRSAVEGALEVHDALEQFVEPMRKDGAQWAQLGEVAPPCFHNGELRAWLKRTAPKKQ